MPALSSIFIHVQPSNKQKSVNFFEAENIKIHLFIPICDIPQKKFFSDIFKRFLDSNLFINIDSNDINFQGPVVHMYLLECLWSNSILELIAFAAKTQRKFFLSNLSSSYCDFVRSDSSAWYLIFAFIICKSREWALMSVNFLHILYSNYRQPTHTYIGEFA